MKQKIILVFLNTFFSLGLAFAQGHGQVEIDFTELTNSPVKKTLPYTEELTVQIINVDTDSESNEVDKYTFLLNSNSNPYDFPEGDKIENEDSYSFTLISLSSNDTITIKDNLEKEKATITFRENGETASQQRIQTPTNDGSEKLEGVGIPIYDALTIRTLKEREDLASIAKIFTLYNITDSVIRKNPFLKDDFEEGIIGQGLTPGFQNFITGIGEADVTNFADGLSRFIVERTKEELNIYFFERFDTFINESAYRVDMKHLFPSTSNILSVAHNEIYDYQRYLPALREAFHEDLREVLPHVSGWLRSDSKLLGEVRNNEKVYGAARFAVDVAAQVNEGIHPGDVLTHLKDSMYLTDIDANFFSGIKAADLVSQSLRSIDSDRYWVQENRLRDLKNDEVLKIYLGLLYETIPAELSFSVNGSQSSLRDIMKKLWENQINNARMSLNSWTTTLAEIDEDLAKIKSVEGDKYVYVARLIERTTRLAANFPHSLRVDKPDDIVLKKVSFYSSHTSNIFASIENEAWHTTVFETYMILSDIWGSENEINQQFLRYGTFMAAVASAENSIEVKEAIEAIALPSGSARIKREAKWNIALNAYTGPFFGRENLPTTTVGGNVNNYSSVIGLSVPVGIAFSYGIQPYKAGRGGKSVSLFLSLLDIGAITSFRFKDDEAEAIPEIQLKNIMAPGALLLFGFGKLPLSAGIGGQVGPELREVTPDFANIYDGYYTRWFLTVAVDIPLLNVYTRTR